jgi:hypothetical protein
MTLDEAKALIAQRKAAAQATTQAASPAEAADVAEITQDSSLPPIARAVQSTLSPSVSLGVVGGIAGGMSPIPGGARMGGVAGTALGTSAEALMRGESPLTLENAKDTVVNVGANLAADYGMGKVASAGSCDDWRDARARRGGGRR